MNEILSEGLVEPPKVSAYDIVASAQPPVRPVTPPYTSQLPTGGFRWIHVNRTEGDKADTLNAMCVLDPLVLGELLNPETRPRSTTFRDGLIVNLRGVNHNPGATPEDLLALHMWVTPRLVVTVADDPMISIRDLRRELEAGLGPRTPIDLLAFLVQGVTARVEPAVTDISEQLDALEEDALKGDAASVREELSRVRREAIVMRRYMAPQREALLRLSTEPIALIDESQRLRLREAANETTLFVEELDLIRERASILYELMYDRRAEEMNRAMVALAVVAVIFLPLNLIAGLLGMNLEGIPGSHSPWAFGIVCGVFVLLAVGGLWLFKRLDWL